MSFLRAARSVHGAVTSEVYARTRHFYRAKKLAAPGRFSKPCVGPSFRRMAAQGHATEGAAEAAAMERFRQMVPELGGNYKGAHGKVAVVGGCTEFTGAPFFAAMSALRVGADMAYVICTPAAAVPIKSYSPELMVLPYLPEHTDDPAAVRDAVERTLPWLRRASCVVVGPGLGDDPRVCATAAELLRACRAAGTPLLVDGSALTHIVAKDASLVAGYRSCVLTPNVAELGRIAGAVGLALPGTMSDGWLRHAPRVAAAFRGPVVLAKGEVDLVCGPGPDGAAATDYGGGAAGGGAAGGGGGGAAEAAAADDGDDGGLRPLLRCSEPGSLRRCGGQGDVLAGTIAAFLGWAAKLRAAGQQPGQQGQQGQQQQQAGREEQGLLGTEDVAACAYAGCAVMRGAAAAAFATAERSMLAGDIIPLLHPTFKRVVGPR